MKVVHKPIVLDAVQWHPGVAIEGVAEDAATVHYSEWGDLYYISRPHSKANHWLSTFPFAEPTEADRQAANGFFGPSLAQFTPPGRPSYWRKVYAFITTKVKVGRTEPADETSDLFLDYASLEKWPKAVPPRATLITGVSGSRFTLAAGDWVVTYPCGKRAVMTDERLRADYDVPLSA